MAPQFKKLTDCPENLREAIDWLIQVRHGGDGNGLEHLGKALKKLIDEAIEKAYTTNLNALLKLLDPSKSYSCCKGKVAEIEKLKEPEKYGNNDLNTLLECVASHKASCYNHLDSSQQKAYDAIVSKLEQLKKLGDGLKGLTDNKNCEKLLTNLCSGLEIFLGFNSTSKGYDGTGIVYSDLDRLCDGVMGFLFKIISEVKENDNLSPYQTTLNKAVNDLKQNLNKGKKGLQTVIGPVKEGIAGWLGEVDEKSEAVKKPLNTLAMEVTRLQKNIPGKDNAQYDGILKLNLVEWLDEVQKLSSYPGASFILLDKIDKNLRRILEPYVDSLLQAAETFRANTYMDHHGLEEVCKTVDEQFRALDKVVSDGLGDETGLKRKIKNEIEALKNHVEKEHPKKLQETIDAGLRTLTDAKKAADTYLQEFESNKNKRFTQTFKRIKELLDEIDKSKNTTDVHQAATNSKLHDDVHALTGMINQMESQLQVGAKGIGKAISASVLNVNNALKQLDAKVQHDLALLKTRLQIPIRTVITFLQRGIRQAGNATDSGIGVQGAAGIIGGFLSGLTKNAETLHKWVQDVHVGSLSRAIEQLKADCGDTSNLKFFQTFLETFADMTADVAGLGRSSTFFDALIEDLRKKVDNKIDEVKNNLPTEMKSYNDHAHGSAHTNPNSINVKIGDITNNLLHFFRGGINEQSTFDFERSDRFGTYHVTKSKILASISRSVDKITKLEELPDIVSSAKQNIEDLINEIKKKYESLNEQVEKTIKTLTTARDQLRQMIQAINAEIDSVHEQAKQYIDEFHSVYKKQSNKASTNIKNSALSNFAKSKAAALQKLKELVQREKGAIDKIIAKDLESGLKGMMKQMNENHTFLETLRTQTELRTATPQVRMYLDVLLQYVEDQVKIPRPQQPKKDSVASTKIANVKTMLGMLLDDLSSSNHFDHTFSRNLADFADSLSALQPSTFAGHTHPELPDAMKGGLPKLVGELGRAYVNVYSGQKIDWERNERGKRNCAKVCITISHTLFHELYCLFYYGATKWKEYSMVGEQNKDELRKYLTMQGFNIENLKKDHSGSYIAVALKNGFKDKYEFHTLPDKSHTNFNLYLTSIDRENGFVAQLFNYVERYYELCHISDSSAGTQPCSVYQMLIWLNGLPHRAVYDKLNFDYFSELFEKPDSADTEGIELEGLSLSDLNAETLAAYPHDVTVTNITEALTDVCSQSYYLLTNFVGHGHANGVYACDYSNNAFNLSYPSSPGACFEMLVDFLNRLYQQLFFLYTHCSNDENCSGWRNCWYGQHVGGSAWTCNTMQCPNQKGNQMCNQKCDQTVECGIKSPLQSFLEDGLPGFLPHSFTKPGCKLTCTVSNHRGLPCITPMGFADLSVAASCTQQGVHLKNILKDFCGSKAAPLTQLCAQFMCILQKPPQTLGDIFAFYYSYLEEWADGFYGKPPKTSPYTKAAFNDAVTEANFREQYSGFNPSILVSTSKHGEEHSKGNLCSIANCKSGSVAPCGLYVKSVTQEIFNYYSSEHKANHLSWFVYITETFYDLLKKLYDDCCNKCGPTGSKCYTKSCDEKCSVKYTTDKTEQVSAVSTEHQPTCKSIVTCRDTYPTLYKYGFTFGNAITLNGSRGNTGAKRTCKDFCEALKLMLDENSVLIALRKQIDKFLWDIREKFSFTILALWLLSLLYLTHIMVIRLDLLHIKSHLHSPSSHRIAAQSLLAAARVKSLNKVLYLQP